MNNSVGSEQDSQVLAEENPLSSGIKFFAIKNYRNRLFLPSNDNLFGEMKYSRVLVDTGCSSILLPLHSTGDLSTLMRAYPPVRLTKAMTDYHWKIAFSSKVGGSSLVLVIEKDPSSHCFPVSLMRDVLGTQVQTSLNRLRFSLSTEDIKTLLDRTFQNVFTALERKKLLQINAEIPRRQHVLLGQDVLSKFSCIRHGKVAMYFDVQVMHDVKFGWLEVRLQADCLKDSTEYPEGFADWEDEFNALYDDEEFDLDDM